MLAYLVKDLLSNIAKRCKTYIVKYILFNILTSSSSYINVFSKAIKLNVTLNVIEATKLETTREID